MKHITRLPLVALVGVLPAAAVAGGDDHAVSVTGSIQTEWLAPETDDAIGANKNVYNANFIGNTYIGLNLESKYVTAGVRFETMENPLPGFENKDDLESFAGTGLPYFQVTGRYKWAELTAGTFYEQFGSGFILRAYEERTLGVDNSLLGGRLVLRPVKGLQVKALGGVQRYHFSWTDSYVLGADVEMNLDQWISGLGDNGHNLTLGISGVSKHEGNNLIGQEPLQGTQFTDENGEMWQPEYFYTLKTPKNVGAFDVRLQYQKNGYNILAEYAFKGNDPNSLNDYVYKNGQVAMLSASYSKPGFSVILQAKRSENMAFRSLRSLNKSLSSCYINHQPAFAYQHTYSLAALYPYGTQMDGEWAYQGEVSYRFKRHTALGGKYGTLLRLNASHIRGLDYKEAALSKYDKIAGTNGASTSFFGMTDDVYYQDINLTMEKKLSKTWKLTAMYMNQQYNKTVIEGSGGIIKCNIGVLDAKWQPSNRFAVRAEAQYLQTKQDEGDWTFGLLEFSIQPGWMFTISDQWNNGDSSISTGEDSHNHYVNGSVVYSYKAHRLQVGYGRKRQGMDCTGGVCRAVPASRGFSLAYNYSF